MGSCAACRRSRTRGAPGRRSWGSARAARRSPTRFWNVGLKHLGAARAGLFVNLEPLVGALLGVGLLGEHFGAGAVVGGALILAAALLAR